MKLKKKEHLLFVCARVGKNSPQGIRYSAILNNLMVHYQISFSSREIFVNDLSSMVGILPDTVKVEHTYFGSRVSRLVKSFLKSKIEKWIFPDKYLFALFKHWNDIKRLSGSSQVDAVLIGMTPYSLYILVYFVKRYFKNAKIIIDLSDPFIENQGLIYPKVYEKFLVAKYEKHFLKWVDQVIVLNPKIKTLYLSYYSSVLDDKKIEVIEQGYDDNFIKNSHLTNQDSKSTIVYAGSFIPKLREPFELYKALESFIPNLKLDLYGNIPAHFLPDNKTINYEYHGSINQNKLYEVYSRASLIVLIDNKSGYQVPGKTLELAALRKPVLFLFDNETSSSFYYIRDLPSFFMVKNDHYEIRNFIMNFISNKISFSYDYDIEQYSWYNLSKKYFKVLDSLKS